MSHNGCSQPTVFFWELLKSNNDVVGWSLAPRVVWDNLSSYSLELTVGEDTLVALLDLDLVTSIDESLGGGWSESGSVLKWFAYENYQPLSRFSAELSYTYTRL